MVPGRTGEIAQLRELVDELDTHGALRADLAQFYGLNVDDVWTGDLSVRHVIVLTEHLMLNPHSRVYAIRGGSPELQGWDAATVVAVRTHNLIVSLLQGLSGKKDPEMFIDYPGAEEHENTILQPATLADLVGGALEKFIRE